MPDARLVSSARRPRKTLSPDPVPLQFAAFPVSALGVGSPILAGSKVLVKSVATGKYCRVVSAGNPPKQQILCDVDAGQATPMDYTGTGFAYQDQPFTNPGGGQPLYLGGPGTPSQLVPGEGSVLCTCCQ